MEPKYWRDRLFKSSYTYKGRQFRVRTWSVKIQHRGQRKTFSLPFSHRRQVAAAACQLYRTIVSQRWGNADAQGERRHVAAGLPLEPTEAPRRDRFDRNFWAQRLIHREYTMSLDQKHARELSVRVDHQGMSHYFPLRTDDPDLAASRALRIYRAIVSRGWKTANERFRRELTVAFRWLDNPLAWTYTTIHTQTNAPRQRSADSFDADTDSLKVNGTKTREGESFCFWCGSVWERPS